MKTKLTFLLCLTIFVLTAQKPAKHLLSLKEGVLLIQLKTSTNQIESLLKRGLKREAHAIKLKNEAYHQALRKAFKEHYNFSRFGFFYNIDATAILTGDFKNKLYDFNGKLAAYEHDGSPIYILDIGKFIAAGEFSSVVNEEGFIIKKIEANQAISINGKPPFFYPAPTLAPTNVRKERIFNRHVRLFNQRLETHFQRVAQKYRRKQK